MRAAMFDSGGMLRAVGRLMRVCLVLALAALVPAVALAASAAQRVRVTGDCLHEQYKPKSIVLACGDGNTFVEHLKWTRWGRRTATGSGTFAINTCTPSCAAGKLKTVAAKVTLSRPGTCRKHPGQVFKQIDLIYATSPGAGVPKRFTIACPIS